MFEVQDVSRVTKRDVIGGPIEASKRLGVLLHTTDGRNSLAWLQGASAVAGKPASADYLITRSGHIYKLMPKGHYAWHAGVTNLSGKVDTADYVSRSFIGIEVENADSAGQLPTRSQHEATAGLLLLLATVYDFSPLHVYGHYALAFPMGRRSDPHAWDWGLMFWLMAFAQAHISLLGDLSSIIAEGGE
jgi:N-acetyl-anhydromuramyl-L-alanine amidase AmpD